MQLVDSAELTQTLTPSPVDAPSGTISPSCIGGGGVVISTRKCVTCGETHPLEHYYTQSPTSKLRKTQCRKCVYAAHRARIAKDPSSRKRSQALYRKLSLAGSVSERLSIIIKAKADVLRGSFGDRAAQKYLSGDYPSPNPRKPKIWKIRSAVLAEILGHPVSINMTNRIMTMNKCCGKPLLSVGWQCSGCGIFQASPVFFELDHIVPRFKGGYGSVGNLQVLCPNCHKIKTQGLLGLSIDHNFKIKPINSFVDGDGI